jgi:hypothetical protein
MVKTGPTRGFEPNGRLLRHNDPVILTGPKPNIMNQPIHLQGFNVTINK